MSGTPLTTQLFDSFLGSQEGIHSIILPDIFSSGGSLNVWIDKYARVKRILGYSRVNGTLITTDTGGSTVKGRALYPYRKTSGGSITRQVLAVVDDETNEYEIHKSTDDGATWTFVADLGAASVGSIPDFAQLGDTLIFTNGKVAPRKWNGTSWTTAGATQSPTVTSAAGSSGVLTGNYEWKLVSVFSDGSRQGGSVASTVLLLSAERGSLSWTADADVTVVGYELYRTSGTGKLFYYVTTIDGRTTVAYTDNTDDFSIIENRVLEEHGDPPPTTYFCEPHKGRMWYFGTDDEPQAGWWSDPGNPESVLDTNETKLHFKDAETQGDRITGARGDFEGLLIVFEERSIWQVSGTGEIVGNRVNWTKSRTNAQTGSVTHRTCVKVPAGSRFPDQAGRIQTSAISGLVYLTPLKDVRLFDGDNDVIISHPVKDTLAALNYEQRAKCFAVSDIERSEVAFVHPSASAGEPDTAVIWNYKFGVWYEREWGFAHIIELDTATDSSILLGISNSLTTGGRVFKLWDTNAFDSANFRAQWMTKTLYGVNEQGQPALSHRKRWRWGEFLFETESNVTLTVEWLQGDSPDLGSAIGSMQFSPTGYTVLTSNGDSVLTADGDAVLAASASTLAHVPFKVDRKYLHHRGMRLRIYDNAQDGSWSLEAMNLAYQILPGQKRPSGSLR